MSGARLQDRHLERAIRSRAEAAEATKSEAADEKVLRAKYLDWCSARIAERFLELTPDEIYVLAQQAGAVRSGEESVGPEASERLESFRRVVMRVTEVLASTVSLPAFEEWRTDYRGSPERYDEEMLGFWKESL